MFPVLRTPWFKNKLIFCECGVCYGATAEVILFKKRCSSVRCGPGVMELIDPNPTISIREHWRATELRVCWIL